MKVGFIGAGNMGGAIARATAKAIGGDSVYLTDQCEEKAAQLAQEISAHTATQSELLQTCDYVFLGVKPQVLPAVLDSIREPVLARQGSLTLISMAAGVAIETILGKLSPQVPLIRIMPNTPVSVGAGMVLYACSSAVTAAAKADFLTILSQGGVLDELPEKFIDAACAVSGCGPAFVCLFAEAMADGGVACGLPREKAMLYAAQTLLGTATLLEQSGKHPGVLKDAVCSPGGTTIQGVRKLEAGGLRSSVSEAVIAAYEFSKKIG